jgi:hypothetical protein
MKPFSALIKKPARKAALAAMPTRVMKTGVSRSVVGGVARSARTAGARRLRGFDSYTGVYGLDI